MSTKNFKYTNNIGDRLKQARLKMEYNMSDFAILLGISQGALSGLENNKSKPSSETLANIVLHTNINIVWLLTGEYGAPTPNRVEMAKESGTEGENKDATINFQDIDSVINEHIKLVKKFKNKIRAKNLNEKLLEIENISEKLFQKIENHVDIMLDTAKTLTENDSPKKRKRA